MTELFDPNVPGADAAPALTIPKGSVLCVDDEPNILSSLRRLFRGAGLDVQVANGGAAGLEVLQTRSFDVVISDMRMPEMDGTEFLEKVRARWPDTVRLLLTGYSEVSSIVGAINRGEIYRYVSKPWDDNDIVLIVRQAIERKQLEMEKQRLEALTAQQNIQLRELNATLEERVLERTEQLSQANERLKATLVTSIKVFSTLLEMRGGTLAGHSRRSADISRRIALTMGQPPAVAQDVFLAALLHEVGKVGFSDELLRTPLALMTPQQSDEYRRHPQLAEQLLLPLTELRGAIDVITAQFERFDGSGVPHKWAGAQIPLGARILSVASDYDAMQIGTLVQRKLSPEEARTLIGHGSGKRYDPEVVQVFLQVLQPQSNATAGRNYREIEISDSECLQPGMVLTRDLVTPNGLLMLSADHVLDARLIDKIRDFERLGGLRLRIFVREV